MDHDVESLRRAAARSFDLMTKEETCGLSWAEYLEDFLEANLEDYRAAA